MSNEQICEICKAFANGMTAGQIAEVEGLPVEQVEIILSDNRSKVDDIKTLKAEMEA